MPDVLARLTDAVKGAQTKLGVTPDGVIGPVTLKAAAAWLTATQEPPAPPPPPPSPWVLHAEMTFDDGEVPAALRGVSGPYGNTSSTGCVHTMRPSCVTVAQGALRITARPSSTPGTDQGRPFTWETGMVCTRASSTTGTFYPLYGRYEIRARFPSRVGIWPGLWLRRFGGAPLGEIDLAELFQVAAPGTPVQTLHLKGRPNVAKGRRKVDTTTWHTYAVEISPVTAGTVRFRLLIDDVETCVYVDPRADEWTTGVDPARCWDFAAQIFVGGWTAVGQPDSTAPAVLEIDSIRVYTPRVMS